MRYLWALGLLSLAWPVWAQADRADYDLDDNGLIEINDLADLDAIRNALDGSSLHGSSAGCPTAGCRGFELTASLDFDTNVDGKIDAQDAYWNQGKGWTPIGTELNPFSAEFNGKGYQIRNLWLLRANDRFDQYKYAGLFGYTSRAKLRDLALTGALTSVRGTNAGILAGSIQNSELAGIFTSGLVEGNVSGGLIAVAQYSSIRASFSTAVVQPGFLGGGLLGRVITDLTLDSSLATGPIRFDPLVNVNAVAGLIGFYTGKTNSDMTSYWALDSSGQAVGVQGDTSVHHFLIQGADLQQLLCPTSANDSQCLPGQLLYRDWDKVLNEAGQPYWQIGPANRLPALVLNGRLYRDSDGDGVLDEEDQLPLLHGAVVDADADGAPEHWLLTCDKACIQRAGIGLDQFPDNPAASQDQDFDALPDAWNADCDSACQMASGLTLDRHPNDRDNDGVLDAQDTDDNKDGKPDADADSNGLIDIASLAELDAVRYQLNGHGRRLTQQAALDSSGCPGRYLNGQWLAVCRGYELKASLDFDTNKDGKIDEQDAYWHQAAGWQPIGSRQQPFSAEFNGKGHQIRNLWQDLDGSDAGLFGWLKQSKLLDLALTGPLTSVKGSDAGILAAGIEASEVSGIFISGHITGFSSAAISPNVDAKTQIRAVFSSSSVTNLNPFEPDVLVDGFATQFNLKAALGIRQAFGSSLAATTISAWQFDSQWFGVEQSFEANSRLDTALSQLRCPTSANDSQCLPGQLLYQGWDQVANESGQPYWRFGTGNQLPGLVLNGRLYRDSDGDGVLDDEDAFPLTYGAVLDTDNDGFPDRWLTSCDMACIQASTLHLDQFPDNPAASQDNDFDALPDAWHAGCDKACQMASGLSLDLKLNDRDNDGVSDAQDTDDNNDGKPDADADSNGLIDIASLAELDAMRYQLNGHGRRLTEQSALDSSGCPGRLLNGEWLALCRGYELKADLDFDTNADGKMDAQDAYWHNGNGWQAIGSWLREFSAEFNGNGHQIRNLWQQPSGPNAGLFGRVKQARLSDLALTGPLTRVWGGYQAGLLADSIEQSEVSGIFVSGQVGGGYAAGLASSATQSQIRGCLSMVSAEGGISDSGSGAGVVAVFGQPPLIEGCLAVGRIRGDQRSAGVIGKLNQALPTLIPNYFAGDKTPQSPEGSIELAASLAQLGCPTQANDPQCAAGTLLYQGWDQLLDSSGKPYWQFGSGNQLPGLRLKGRLYRDSDGDGALDEEDAFPLVYGAVVDSDNDGAPDSWTRDCDLACQQASGLVLDAFPRDASVSLDANGNGVPDRWNFGCDQSCQQAAGYSLDPQNQVNGFWRHSDGQNYLLQYQGSQLVNAYPLVSVGNDWQLQGAGDFNGDGASDLLWRHQTSGELYLFLFDRGQIRQQLRLGQVADPDWKLRAIADVDGDKTSDLIWYHAKTGQGVSWLLKQGALSQELGLPQLTSLDWQLIGSGDLTGDGVDDLIWRHSQTGDLSLFIMSQGQLQQAKALFSVIDSDWKLLAVADTDADKHADLIWGHQKTGQVYLFLMQGEQGKQQGSLLQLTDLNWQLVGVQDFDQDNKADLWWRNRQTGDNYLFYLDGLNIKSGQSLPAVADTAWQLGALLKP